MGKSKTVWHNFIKVTTLRHFRTNVSVTFSIRGLFGCVHCALWSFKIKMLVQNNLWCNLYKLSSFLIYMIKCPRAVYGSLLILTKSEIYVFICPQKIWFPYVPMFTFKTRGVVFESNEHNKKLFILVCVTKRGPNSQQNDA